MSEMLNRSGRSCWRPHVTTIGARAMRGTVWDTLTHGRRPRSTTRQRSITTASASPITRPSVNPMAASWSVNQAFLSRYSVMGSVLRPSRTSPASSPTMSRAWGIVRSSVETGSSMPVPGTRSLVCWPNHL